MKTNRKLKLAYLFGEVKALFEIPFIASSQALPELKVAIDDECWGKGLVFTKNNEPAD